MRAQGPACPSRGAGFYPVRPAAGTATTAALSLFRTVTTAATAALALLRRRQHPPGG